MATVTFHGTGTGIVPGVVFLAECYGIKSSRKLREFLLRGNGAITNEPALAAADFPEI